MSTYTSSLGLELITPGSQAGLWGNTTNNSLNLIDQAITGVTPISFASASGSTHVLTDYNGAEDEARSAVLNVTGTATGSNNIVIPNKQKTYFVRNSTGQDIVVKTPVPSATCTVGAGYNLPVFCDGNNNVFLAILAPGAGTVTVSGGGTGSTTFGTGGFIKSSGGTNALTASTAVALGSEVSGTLPVTNGGTGATSLASGTLLVGNGTGTVASLSGGVVGYVPTWNGSTWVSAAPAAAGVNSVSVTAPVTITGTASNPVIGFANSGVTAGSYTSANITVDAYGRITTATNGSSSGVASVTGTSGQINATTVSGAVTLSLPSTLTSINTTGNAATATSSTTQAYGDNTTNIATTAYVRSAVVGLDSPIYSVTGTVSANALTVGLTANQLLSFRSATLGSGAISPVNVTTALSLTVPNGATLGMTNGLGARLAILCLYNSGNPALGIINISGSSALLDENSLISTTSMSTASDSSGIVYSASSISNSPFRIVGYVDITEATAGTWSTAPSLVQGISAASDLSYVPPTTISSTSGACLSLVSKTVSDLDAGGMINMVNYNAPSNVRGKYLRVDTGGNFAILSSSYTSRLLTIADDTTLTAYGTAYKPGGGTWTDSSDSRLKENVKPLAGALDKVCSLNPVSFDWKYARPGIACDGFLADEVQSVFPNSVSETDPTDEQKPFIQDGEKVKNIGWQNDMIAYLVASIKELKAEIDTLKAAK